MAFLGLPGFRKVRLILSDERGAAMIEYTVLIGLITASVLYSIIMVGQYTSVSWSTLYDKLVAGTGASAGGGSSGSFSSASAGGGSSGSSSSALAGGGSSGSSLAGDGSAGSSGSASAGGGSAGSSGSASAGGGSAGSFASASAGGGSAGSFASASAGGGSAGSSGSASAGGGSAGSSSSASAGNPDGTYQNPGGTDVSSEGGREDLQTSRVAFLATAETDEPYSLSRPAIEAPRNAVANSPIVRLGYSMATILFLTIFAIIIAFSWVRYQKSRTRANKRAIGRVSGLQSNQIP